jgi:parallel beta-helix repeat protein
MVSRSTQAAAFLVISAAALILPRTASAQAVLSVSPTSVSVQANAGTNPSSQTVRITNAGKGALKWTVAVPSAPWLSVSPTIGVNSGTLTLTFRTSTMGTGQYQTSFRVDSNTGSSITVPVTVNLAGTALPPPPPPPGQLAVSCPANMNVASSNGSPVVVNYSATPSGGVAPYTVTGSPASGSLFPVGSTSVQVTARSSDGQTATCGFTVTVTYTAQPPPPPPSGVGPQTSITCPAGAVQIVPGSNIQTAVNSYPGTTTFCLRAGTYSITSAITPKSGNTFVGEYGAILDGSGWSTSDPDQGAFRSHNEDIDDVTIRNLLIRNMPQRGIHAYYWMSDRWTIEYNEITGAQIGVAVPNNSLVKNNKIHHNTIGGYNGWKVVNTVFDGNEIAYNGPTQKVIGTDRVTFRNNFVHHNVNDGIFYDSDNTNALIEGNRVEDNGRAGIFYEVSSAAVIRNNTVSRQGDTGIFISTAKNVEIYGNTLQDNFRSIQYFLNCDAVGGGTLGFDLSSNSTHDNTIRVGNTSGAFANGFGYLSSCTSTQVAPYLNGSKNLTFTRNTYVVPSMTTKYWLWGLGSLKFWNEWQALGQDTTGTASQ